MRTEQESQSTSQAGARGEHGWPSAAPHSQARLRAGPSPLSSCGEDTPLFTRPDKLYSVQLLEVNTAEPAQLFKRH